METEETLCYFSQNKLSAQHQSNAFGAEWGKSLQASFKKFCEGSYSSINTHDFQHYRGFLSLVVHLLCIRRPT